MEYFELGDRWLHFGAGVLWIGLLYFFNWVNSAFAPTMDAETKKKVVPQLMPRALYWFRWGAAFTWVTGVILLFVTYYHGYDGANLLGADAARTEPVSAMDWLPAFALIFVGFLVYDTLFKALAKQHDLAVVIWGLLATGYAGLLLEVFDFSMRAALIHVGGLFGTTMAANVWMRIWPAQRRIITATKNGQAPDPADPALAGLRSRHNTYLSVPLLFFMVSVNQGAILAIEQWYLSIPAILVIGFVVTKAVYAKAAKVPGF